MLTRNEYHKTKNKCFQVSFMYHRATEITALVGEKKKVSFFSTSSF